MKMVLLVALLLTAAERHPRGAKMRELNETSAGQKVTLSHGEQFRVTLRESGGTGYRWQAGTECSAVLHLDDEHATPGDAGTPGASGARVWVYTANGEGACDLRFVSARSWEKTPSGKTVSYAINVAKT